MTVAFVKGVDGNLAICFVWRGGLAFLKMLEVDADQNSSVCSHSTLQICSSCV